MQQHPFAEEKVELRALGWLADKGYQLISQNWQYCQNNVDIIARYANQLHFISVATRKYPESGLSCQGITRRKILSFLQASQQYMKLNPQWEEVTIDILTITLIREEPIDCVMTKNVKVVCC